MCIVLFLGKNRERITQKLMKMFTIEVCRKRKEIRIGLRLLWLYHFKKF